MGKRGRSRSTEYFSGTCGLSHGKGSCATCRASGEMLPHRCGLVRPAIGSTKGLMLAAEDASYNQIRTSLALGAAGIGASAV